MALADDIALAVASRYTGGSDDVALPEDPGLAHSRDALDAIAKNDPAAFLEAVRKMQAPAGQEEPEDDEPIDHFDPDTLE